MSDKVREQFEAWWVAEYESHTYQHADARNMAWEGWQASRAAALEEAAVVCERISAASKRDGYGTEAAAEQGCADAIRAHPFDKERIWLATVDALQSRLAAAEAEAERAAELLVEASGWMKAECYSLHHRRNQYHASDEACPVEALQSELLARIDAHLASRPEGEVAP